MPLDVYCGDTVIVISQVKFNFDPIDETDLLEETLNPRVESLGGTLEKVLLTGNHVTPCIQVMISLLLNVCFCMQYLVELMTYSVVSWKSTWPPHAHTHTHTHTFLKKTN